MSRDHRKLKAFISADELVLQVYAMTKTFPKEELYALTSQLRRAACSVPANIVEGCGRHTEKDFLRFLDNAMGSLREVGYFLSLAQRLGYMDHSTARTLLTHHDQTCRILSGLIASLRHRNSTRQ